MGIGSAIQSGVLGAAAQRATQQPQPIGGKGILGQVSQAVQQAQPQPMQQASQPAQQDIQEIPDTPAPQINQQPTQQMPQPMGGKGGFLGQQFAQQPYRFDPFAQGQGFRPYPQPPQANPYAANFPSAFETSEAGRDAANMNPTQRMAAEADFNRARGFDSGTTPVPPTQVQPQPPSQAQQAMQQQMMMQQMFRGLGGKGGMRNPYASSFYKNGGEVKK
jgi:hypothetical protein